MTRPRIVAVDGAPGVGKTRRVVAQAEQWQPGGGFVATFTRDAAAEVRRRAPEVGAGTVYSLTWPYVREFTQAGRFRGHGGQGLHMTRRVYDGADQALHAYERDAPSRRRASEYEEAALEVHRWDGVAPFEALDDLPPQHELRYILPMARWLAAGAPMPEEEQYAEGIVDEAQDMSACELAAAAALVRPGGRLIAYGDPGQAIHLESKGGQPNELPAAWAAADEEQRIEGGYRVGDPVASAASAVLRPYWDRPAAAFRAAHTTDLLQWDEQRPRGAGLVLGHSRRACAKAFRAWGMRDTAVVPAVARADDEMVICTGHAAKGAEADDVYLLPWSRVGCERLDARHGGALRLLYVMMTRARRRLHIPPSLFVRLPR